MNGTLALQRRVFAMNDGRFVFGAKYYDENETIDVQFELGVESDDMDDSTRQRLLLVLFEQDSAEFELVSETPSGFFVFDDTEETLTEFEVFLSNFIRRN